MKQQEKWYRIMEIFCRGIMGEELYVKELADEYQVSTKTISRYILLIKYFLLERRGILGNAEMNYSNSTKKHFIQFDGFLESKELFVLVEILIGSRALSQMDLLKLVDKLKKFTTHSDRKMLNNLVIKEMYHYQGVKLDCENLIDNVWRLINTINNKKEITILYYKMDRTIIERRIRPLSIMVSEYYFYLIAASADDETFSPRYYRIDRITKIVEHRDKFVLERKYDFDEGALRDKIQFMWPGECMKIVFKFTGPSVQAVLDRIPTAKVVQVKNGEYTVEAEVYGDGIKMYLLSQGSFVKVLRPEKLVMEMKEEVRKMIENYERKGSVVDEKE